MLATREVLLHARVDRASLETWVTADWVRPRQQNEEPQFSETDLARVCLIRDLRDTLGVNEEGIAVALDLLDQVHGLRQALRRVMSGLQGLPGPLRREVLAAVRAATGDEVGRAAPT